MSPTRVDQGLGTFGWAASNAWLCVGNSGGSRAGRACWAAVQIGESIHTPGQLVFAKAATLVEVPTHERAPVIRAYLLRAGRRAGSKAVANEARSYFGVSADPSLEEIQPVVEHYPVFRIVEDGGPSA